MKIKVVKKGTSKGKPSSYCSWFIGDWKGPAT